MVAGNVTWIERIEDETGRGDAETAPYESGLERMVASSQAVINGSHAISSELLAFVQSRVKGGLEFADRLAARPSPEGVMEAQIEFTRSAAKAYADELQRLGELSSRLLDDALRPLHAGAEDAAAREHRVAA